uniref:Vitellogenin n=1 Tax=Meloidogyne floridensis TaxID=298350 RepID=A0A915NG60_9BILA
RNNPKTISEYKKNYMQDMALVMIEGCVICGNSSNQTITLRFIQLHPKGPIENACPEINENISTLDLDLTKYNNGFIVGGIVSDRLCPSRKSLVDDIEIAPLTYKHKFKIEIEHSCEGEKTKHIINFASEIDIKNLTDHVFEMRGLSINLTGNSTEETYDWEKTANEYFIPKKAAELKTTTESVPTIETINNTTEATNTTTIRQIVLPKNGIDLGGIYDEAKEDEK